MSKMTYMHIKNKKWVKLVTMLVVWYCGLWVTLQLQTILQHFYKVLM